MRYGKITQTAWQRSVRKQLHMKKGAVNGEPTPWGGCAGISADGFSFFWTDSSVSGKSPRAGYYAVLEAAGALAAEGVRTEDVSVRILFPYGAGEAELKAVTAGIQEACSEIGVRIADIQGEVSPAAAALTVFVSAAGKTEDPSGSRTEGKKLWADREILMCGYAGLEGTLRILDEAEEELRERFVTSFLEQTKKLKKELVRPDQILEAFEKRGNGTKPFLFVRQIGSGGVFAALWETAEILQCGFEIGLSSVLLKQETVEICEFYRLNPYQMVSGGSFLLVTDDAENVIEVLEKAGARAGRLGVIKAQKARVITSGEEIRYLDRPAADALVCWAAERMEDSAGKKES